MAEMTNLPEKVKGIIFVAAGFILLLRQFGILPQPLSFYIVVFFAFYMIVVGFFKLNGMNRIQKMMKKEGQ